MIRGLSARRADFGIGHSTDLGNVKTVTILLKLWH